MPRILLAAALLAATLVAPQAQDAAAPTDAAATPQITVDPRAIVDAMPQQGMLLTGLYATQATIDLCTVAVGEPGATAMSAHRRQLESELRMDAATAEAAYAAIKGDVEKAGVDCAEGSADRAQADQVIAIYSGQVPAPAAAAPTAAPAATPAQ